MSRQSPKIFIVYILIMLGGILLGGYGLYSYRNPRIVIEWETATEIDTVGFNLYRADQPGGPFSKLNYTIIPSSSEPLQGGTYRYVDASVVPNQLYYYQLEDIDTQGNATKHKPISAQVEPQGIIELALGIMMVLVAAILWKRETPSNRIAKAEQATNGST